MQDEVKSGMWSEDLEGRQGIAAAFNFAAHDIDKVAGRVRPLVLSLSNFRTASARAPIWMIIAGTRNPEVQESRSSGTSQLPCGLDRGLRFCSAVTCAVQSIGHCIGPSPYWSLLVPTLCGAGHVASRRLESSRLARCCHVCDMPTGP